MLRCIYVLHARQAFGSALYVGPNGWGVLQRYVWMYR